MTCMECSREAKWRVTRWVEDDEVIWDCGEVCGIHGRKYGRLGFSLCRLKVGVVRFSIRMEYY